jgi:hypothetical protein
MTVNVVSFKDALLAKLVGEEEYVVDVAIARAVTEILCRAIYDVRERGATSQQIVDLLRHGIDRVEWGDRLRDAPEPDSG